MLIQSHNDLYDKHGMNCQKIQTKSEIDLAMFQLERQFDIRREMNSQRIVLIWCVSHERFDSRYHCALYLIEKTAQLPIHHCHNCLALFDPRCRERHLVFDRGATFQIDSDYLKHFVNLDKS